MKCILIVASLLLGAGYAQANLNADDLANLPVVQNVQIIIDIPPPMLTVQPTGSVAFDFASCAPKNFSSLLTFENNVYFIKLVTDNNFDCRGPETIRSYEVQFSSDAKMSDRVIILNPQTTKGYVSFP